MLDDGKEFLPLYRDIVFKHCFGDSDNTKFTYFLLEVFFNKRVGYFEDAIILNSVKLNRKTVVSKRFEVDVLVKTKDEEVYILEAQTVYNKNSEIKNTMYFTDIFSNIIKSGETYLNIRPVTLINFVKDMKIHQTDEIIKSYELVNNRFHEDKVLENYFRIYIVDIDKSSGVDYNTNRRLNEMRQFMKASSYKEALRVAKGTNNPIYMELLERMVKFMNKEYVQDYSKEEKLIRSNLELAFMEGHISGLAEGELKKQLEIAKMLMQDDDISIEKVSKYTGLSKEKLLKLKEN